MELKITLRDIMVYFVTGVTFLVFFLLVHFWGKFCDLKHFAYQLSENNVLLLISVAGVYIIGHVIQSIDAARLLFVKKILKPIVAKTQWRAAKFILRCLTGDRIEGVLPSTQPSGEFWRKAFYLQVKGKHSHSEYWYVTKDLLNGMETAATLLLLYSLHNGNYPFVVVFTVMTILFWIKSRHVSTEYIDSVNETYTIIEQEKNSAALEAPPTK